MTKTQTKLQAGRAVAAYVEDGQGRRLLVASPGSFLSNPVIVAMTQKEAKEAIGALKQLMEELPP